jgi:type II secretory pathway pseudopilin PulG
MLIATFGPTTAWDGKTIKYEDGRFILEGWGQISPEAVLGYDGQGHLAWVQGLAQGERPVASPRRAKSPWLVVAACAGVVVLVVVILAAMAIPAYQHQREKARVEAVREGIATIRTGLDKFCAGRYAYPVASAVTPADLEGYVHEWPLNPYTGRPMAQGHGAGDFSYWRDTSGLSFALAGHTADGTDIKYVHRVPDDEEKRSIIAEGLHSIEVGIESYGIDHAGTLPQVTEVTQAGLGAYVDEWPVNPYTGLPMTQGTALGNFVYSLSPDAKSFQVTAFGPNGTTLTLPLQ